MSDRKLNERRVLVIAPLGADARNIADLLARAEVPPAACPNLSAAALEIDEGCGAIVLTEEALAYSRASDLGDALAQQPPWSDIPLVMLVSANQPFDARRQAIQLVGARTNLVVLERPLHMETLLSAVHSALRARERQYQVRDLLQVRDDLLATLERRVEERTARLQELNAELETFSYSVSHDLRAPLRSMEGYARALRDDHSATLSDEGKHFAERIVKNAEKMDRLMQDVLSFSRLTRAEMRLDTLDLDAVLADVLDQYPDLRAAYRQITIAAPLGTVYGHAPSLVQCFSNLLHNALKFVPPDRTPEVRVSSEPAGGRLRVSVRDNGIGIAPAHQQRIFGMFERASPASVPGTGIGLAIVKKAVERMGGTVGVDSAPGQGACFWIELPRPQ